MAQCFLGMDGVVNYKIGGVASANTWTELDIVRQVTLGMERSEADATTRANNGIEAVAGALLKLTFELEMRWDTTDAGFNVIKQHFLDKTTIGLQVLDQDSGEGWEADVIVLQFPRAEEIEGVMTTTAVLKPTCSDTPPEWVLGGTGSA
jgi:hypothetical protein